MNHPGAPREDPLRTHYSALRGALAAEPSEARATRLLLLAKLEARAEQRRERRHAFFTGVVALGCALFVGFPAAWALSHALAPARTEPAVLAALPVPQPASQSASRAPAVAPARAPRAARAALRRRRAPSVLPVTSLATAPETQSVEARETLEPSGDPAAPSAEPVEPVGPLPGAPPARADLAPPASYARAIDLVRRMHDAEAEPLLREVLAESRSAHWRREAARVLELLLARRSSEEGLRTSQ